MTPYIIIPSTFDEVSHAIKKKSCGNIKIVTEPTDYAKSCPKSSAMSRVSDDLQFKLQISNLKSLDIIHDALH